MNKKFLFFLLLLLIISCSTNKEKKINYDGEPFDEIISDDLPNNQENNKLIVGILLPLSGKAQKIGDSMLKSAQMSMFDNKLNNIALMSYDTKGSAFGAIEAINSAIRDKVDIIVGPFFTEETKAILDIADANDIIVISFSDNQSLLLKNHPNLYLFGLTPKQEIYRIVSYLADYRNMYGFSAMFPNNSYGNIVSNIFKEVMFRKDTRSVKTDFYSKNDPMLEKRVKNVLNTNVFRDEVYQKYEEDKGLAKANGIREDDVEFKYTKKDKIFADAILLPDSGPDIIKIAEYYKKYANSKNNKPILIGTSKWLNNNLYTNKDFEGALFVSPNPSNYITFDDKFHDVFQTYPLRVATLAYDAITAIMESHAKAQNKQDIRLALENYQGFEGVNGTFRFLNTGFVERRLAIIKITNGKYEIINYDSNPFLKY